VCSSDLRFHCAKSVSRFTFDVQFMYYAMCVYYVIKLDHKLISRVIF